MRPSIGIHTTQRTGQQRKDSKYLHKHHMLQVRPAWPLKQVMPLQIGRTRKLKDKGSIPDNIVQGIRNSNVGLCDNLRVDEGRIKSIKLSVDIMFVNKIPFVISLGKY